MDVPRICTCRSRTSTSCRIRLKERSEILAVFGEQSGEVAEARCSQCESHRFDPLWVERIQAVLILLVGT